MFGNARWVAEIILLISVVLFFQHLDRTSLGTLERDMYKSVEYGIKACELDIAQSCANVSRFVVPIFSLLVSLLFLWPFHDCRMFRCLSTELNFFFKIFIFILLNLLAV